ncbi:DNA polymerase III subunit epsilon [Alkalilimnicola ehrlichii]|uniref:DNA polymerase III subunit epsilon n=1 Tax=Alkalilimnicola ehrlichii TaxID=351052 RepID=A0A3E0X3B5_9GAMM|nr:DNA polymerase III subunit epsilon [Alkalilimnicola ehrlichii]RFA30856.1 DNA polymerase III subunit epsilon [Alkalilimnicola ehrlichii]RFA38807.1 DNA polymerase III subunit epsilon [Alkalilimnicola ehrlichii]
MRQIVLDTETTGLEPSQGHRIIEIGCVELINRRPTNNYFHHYLQPDREIDEGAIEVHGITNEFLQDKPRFGDVAQEFLDFVRGAELVIHNAAFDVGFINHELKWLDPSLGKVEDICSVLDTLLLARGMHPGQRNSLDALCKRYGIDNSQRDLHGALLDARILADVYLAMTGGQTALLLDAEEGDTESGAAHSGGRRGIRRLPADRPRLAVVRASDSERAKHERWLERLDKAAGGDCLWRQMEAGEASKDE